MLEYRQTTQNRENLKRLIALIGRNREMIEQILKIEMERRKMFSEFAKK
jgi:hypothetical protein